MARRLCSRRLLWLLNVLSRQLSTVQSLLAVPTPSSRHDFSAQCPRTFLFLLCSITSSLSTILRRALGPSVSPVESFNDARVGFIILGSCFLAYCSLLHRFEHVYNGFVFEQRFEVSSFWRFANRDFVGFEFSLSICTEIPRSLRHPLHSGKKCATVSLLPPHYHQRSSSALPILTR